MWPSWVTANPFMYQARFGLRSITTSPCWSFFWTTEATSVKVHTSPGHPSPGRGPRPTSTSLPRYRIHESILPAWRGPRGPMQKGLFRVGARHRTRLPGDEEGKHVGPGRYQAQRARAAGLIGRTNLFKTYGHRPRALIPVVGQIKERPHYPFGYPIRYPPSETAGLPIVI